MVNKQLYFTVDNFIKLGKKEKLLLAILVKANNMQQYLLQNIEEAYFGMEMLHQKVP